MANVLVALDRGIKIFDASVAAALMARGVHLKVDQRGLGLGSGHPCPGPESAVAWALQQGQ